MQILVKFKDLRNSFLLLKMVPISLENDKSFDHFFTDDDVQLWYNNIPIIPIEESQ